MLFSPPSPAPPDTGIALDLLADIGGTNARVVFRDEAASPVHLRRTADFPGLEALLADVVAEAGARPRRIALAVAGPVTGDDISLTNLPWRFSARALAAHFGASVVIENDVAAAAWALAALDSRQLLPLTETAAQPEGAKVVVAPGTGLGVAALVPDRRGGWCAVASEGSHAGFASPHCLAADDRAALKACDASWEDLVSGIGLPRLYRALGGNAAVDTPEAVTERATDREALAVRTLDMFSLLLGAFAGDAALMFAGRGGCYLAGGLLASLGDLFKPDLFLKGFHDKDRFRDYISAIPVYRVVHPQPALVGLGVMLDRIEG